MIPRIATNVRKIKCKIEDDNSYTCNITSGTHTNWFARCMGDFVRNNTKGARDIRSMNYIFRTGARACRGKQHKYAPMLTLEGKPVGAPETVTYYAKTLHIGKGIKEIKIGDKNIDMKNTGIVCFFDEDKDLLFCDKYTGTEVEL